MSKVEQSVMVERPLCGHETFEQDVERVLTIILEQTGTKPDHRATLEVKRALRFLGWWSAHRAAAKHCAGCVGGDPVIYFDGSATAYHNKPPMICKAAQTADDVATYKNPAGSNN